MKWVLEKPLETLDEVHRFEKQYAIKFPEGFIDVVSKYNAGRPRPNVFDSLEEKELIAKSLLSFNVTHLDNIWDTTLNLKKRFPINIIPFMLDQFGNYVCFEFDPLEEEPLIVFWHHEQEMEGFQKVANKFDEYLAMFYEIN